MHRLAPSALALFFVWLVALAPAAAALPDAAPPAVTSDAEPAPAPLVTGAPAASAPSAGVDNKLSLRELIDRATRAFTRGDYDTAIAELTVAYQRKPVAQFLFNIAQAHRKAGRPQDALVSYQLFLRKAPDTPLRAETEAYIELVRTQLAARPAEPVKPAVAIAPVAVAPTPSKAEARVPPYRRAWTWIAVGAAVAVTTGVAVGVYLGTRPPPTTLGIVEPTF